MTYDSYNNLTILNNYDITLLEGKITSLSYQNIDQVRYTYDATGRRIKKEIYNQNTQTYDVINYVYINDVLIKEIHDDKTITYILDDTGVIGFKVKTSTTEDTYYYIKNTQQDIISIVNENFVEVANYIYDAYGNIVNINQVNQNEIAKLNPYRYRSYYYDTETNYYYLNARYYKPEIGRFITKDDIEYLDTENTNGLNLYCYCLNNPINNVDYSGHFVISTLFWVIVAVAALTTIGAVTYGAIEEETVVLDLSFSVSNNVKAGGSLVLDFEGGNIELYPHIGQAYGMSSGLSYSVGKVWNYTGPGSYGGFFTFAGGGYYFGVDGCFNPFNPTGASAKSVTFSGGGSIYDGWDWYCDPISFNYKEWKFNEIEKEG